jgi:F0F1-type ATP synthase assembly protein I
VTGRPDKREQDDRRRRSRSQARAYQAAVEAVVAILIAAGIGYWVDGRFDTSPWGLLLGTAVGFASFVHRLLTLGRQLNGSGADETSSEGPDR